MGVCFFLSGDIYGKKTFGKYPAFDCHKILVSRVFGSLDLYTREKRKEHHRESEKKN